MITIYRDTPFIGEDNKYYYLYKITNLENNKIYIGKHWTNNLNDKYKGSGKLLQRAYAKYKGTKNFTKEILEFFYTPNGLLTKESIIVNKEFLERNDVYNVSEGGWNNFKSMVAVKDNNGKICMIDTEVYKNNTNEYTALTKNKFPALVNGAFKQISVTDPEYLNGNIHHISYKKVSVIDKNGFTKQVSIDDPEYLNGNLKGVTYGFASVKDEQGIVSIISIKDPRYKVSLFPVSKGCAPYIDSEGNNYWIKTDDPRIASGELFSPCIGLVAAKDKEGNHVRVRKDDPRILSGELIGSTKGYVMARFKNGKRTSCSPSDPRILSGELIVSKEEKQKTIKITKRKWMNKDYLNRKILYEEVDFYLAFGWSLGLLKNKK